MGSGFFQDRLDVDRDVNVISNDNAASVYRVIPTDAEIVAIDRRRGDKAGARLWSLVDAVFPPGRLPLPEVMDIQRCFARNSADGEVAADSEVVTAQDLDLIAAESDLRMICHIQKISAAQMIVSLWLAGPDSFSVYDCLDGRVFRIVGIELEIAMNIFEVAAHITDHHVPSAKLRRRMSRFKTPFSHDRNFLSLKCSPLRESFTKGASYFVQDV